MDENEAPGGKDIEILAESHQLYHDFSKSQWLVAISTLKTQLMDRDL